MLKTSLIAVVKTWKFETVVAGSSLWIRQWQRSDTAPGRFVNPGDWCCLARFRYPDISDVMHQHQHQHVNGIIFQNIFHQKEAIDEISQSGPRCLQTERDWYHQPMTAASCSGSCWCRQCGRLLEFLNLPFSGCSTPSWGFLMSGGYRFGKSFMKDKNTLKSSFSLNIN